tara:strand:- start:11691 stop:12620 length:930 start_codon:yes stop_codon:yes gene_type:complete
LTNSHNDGKTLRKCISTDKENTLETQAQAFTFDQFKDEYYDPSLYRYDNTATGIATFDDVTDEHINYYKENGFLVVQNAFPQDSVKSWLDAIHHLIDGNNPDFTGVQYEGSLNKGQTTSPVNKREGVRKLNNFVEFDPRLKTLSDDNILLSIISKMIGSDPELFVSQAFLKPSGIGREKPWHQDHAFFDVPIGTPIASCWIALDKATRDNGCMHVKPGTHNEGPTPHFVQRDFQICDTHLDLTRDVMVPLNPGGILFFDGMLHHGTPANRSSTQRRAMTLTYIPKETHRISSEERLSHFGGEDAGDVTC